MRPLIGWAPWLPTACLVVALAAILAFFYAKTQAGDDANFRESIASLRQLKQLDASSELGVLRAKIGIDADYDALADSLLVMKQLRDRLRAVVVARNGLADSPLVRSDDALAEVIDSKARQIERFKSHNAVLRNSIIFLPSGTAEAQKTVGLAAGVTQVTLAKVSARMNSTLLSSLLYAGLPSDDRAAEIGNELERLTAETANFPAESRDGVETLVMHVRSLLLEQPMVDALVASIDALPMAARIDELDDLLSAEQRAADLQARQYRLYLLVFAAALVGLLIYAAVSLIRSHALVRRVNRDLQGANATLEHRVDERTGELKVAQSALLAAARQAGMAEIATNVLHNVGNVLNSVNISAGLVTTRLRESKTRGLSRAVQMIDDNASRLGEFFSHDPKGRVLPAYLRELSAAVAAEQQGMADELETLCKSVDHIKDIVSTQQSYAGASSVAETVRLEDLIEDALRMNAGSLTRHNVNVVKQFADLPPLLLDRHRLLQILVNLISNAKHALDATPDGCHQITLGVDPIEADKLRIHVVDNGEGIAADNLSRIFAHGFTTRTTGHGFGLHSCVIAAQEMGGTLTAQSDGPGRGATFTLELPARPLGNMR